MGDGHRLRYGRVLPQHDPQYAAEHPEEHAAKEEIYENLMAGRISALDEKLAALGRPRRTISLRRLRNSKTPPAMRNFLTFDPAVIKAALEDPDKSHVDEMLAFAEQAGREYEAELAGQAPAPSPDDGRPAKRLRTPRGTFHVTDMSREQMEAAGYGFHHQSDDGKYLVMGNGSRAFAIRSEEAQEHAAPEKMTVLVVEPMKEPYGEGDRPRPPFVTGGSGRRHCHRLSRSPTRWGWSATMRASSSAWS